MSLQHPINSYIKEFLSERRITEGSEKTYRLSLGSWVTWMVQNADIRNPKKSDLIAWIRYMEGAHRSQLTIFYYVSVVKLFFTWMESKFYCENIAAGITNRRPSKVPRKQYIRIGDLTAWLGTLTEDTVMELRNKCIINLMVTTGFRGIEVVRFDVKDLIRGQEAFIMRIQRKGHKEKDQLMGIPDEIGEMIVRYIESDTRDYNEPLFRVEREYRKGERMTIGALQKMISTKLQKAGLSGKGITPHSLRHTAIVCALKDGGSEFDAQVMAGHTSPRTTAIYTELLKQETMQVNPGAKRAHSFIKNAMKTAQELILN